MNATSTKIEAAATKAANDAPDPLRIWNALSKTDPAQTKGFKRAGGFSGTAVKPIWVVKRLTEEFGPCGVGWGIGEPSFQVVEAGAETLVYCTVSCWHNNGVLGANPVATLYGVGGDKVVTKRSSGPFCDDEAFKKAFTDAVNNAFKFIGVAADIHMGLFDDSKYLAEVSAEFAPVEPVAEKPAKLDGPITAMTTLKAAIKAFAGALDNVTDLADLTTWLETPEVVDLEKQAMRDLPGWWDTGEGCTDDYEPVTSRIHRKKRALEEGDNIHNFRSPIDAG